MITASLTVLSIHPTIMTKILCRMNEGKVPFDYRKPLRDNSDVSVSLGRC